MTLLSRKIIVLSLIGIIFLTANLWFAVNWLDEHGVVNWAQHIRAEYVTGTAITIVIALMILLVRPKHEAAARTGLFRRCPVCDHVLIGKGAYCAECGSKV